MFENILGQSAADQLVQDIGQQRLAPAMLFQGPECSGKGSAALELGRVISCEKEASWNCSCSACMRQRLLLHPDMLCLGARPFSAEIAATADAFQREAAGRLLFIRSIRKLLARFNPVLWDDEPKFTKVKPLLNSLEDELDELNATADNKLMASILKDAYKLESEAVSETIPIAQIRRAAAWSHLAPTGRRKLLIIENSDRMQEGARNALLKLLEEPPSTVFLVLCSSRPKALLPTILSRLRPYRFNVRDEETEREVIRRIFRCDNFEGKSGGLINEYLHSFLPVSSIILEGLAAFFAASASFNAALIIKKQGNASLPQELVNLGKFASPLAEEAGLEKERDSKGVTAKVMEKALNFNASSVFHEFLNCLLTLVMESVKESASPSVIAFIDLWQKCISQAETAVLIYNQNASLALEGLFISLSRGMAERM